MWYDTIIIIKVDQTLSDFFHSQTFNKVKKRLWPSPLLKLKACFSRQVDVVPPQPVAAKVTVLYVAVHLNLRSVVSYFTPLNYSLSLLSRYGKLIERPWGGANCNRFPIQTRIFSKERVGEGGPFHLLPWRWSETERRGSVQRHLLLPLGIQGPVHLHILVHETWYFNVLASRFDFQCCE